MGKEIANCRVSPEILLKLKQTAKKQQTSISSLLRRGLELVFAEIEGGIENSKKKKRYS